MMDRIIFLGTGIDDQIANIVQAQLFFLESADASKDIQIYESQEEAFMQV
jgi:ATP-dependent Clp protease protease subunit